MTKLKTGRRLSPPRNQKQIDPDRSIQWHLRTTKYDRSPCCDASMGYISRGVRWCLADDCDRVWTDRPPKGDA